MQAHESASDRMLDSGVVEMPPSPRPRTKRPYATPRIAASLSLDEGAVLPGDQASLTGVLPVSLRETRARVGLTVAALAARSGISEATILRIEHGKTSPRGHIVHRLGEALGVSPWLVTEFRPKLESAGLRQLYRLVT